MKTRDGDAFMSADDDVRSLPEGVGVNLWVRQVKQMTMFPFESPVAWHCNRG